MPDASVAVVAATVILVHGAWADGSSWSKVISRLQQKGVQTVAVQNPLTSLNDDVAAVNRAIEQILNSGRVTADLKPKGAPSSTSQVGDAICEAL